MRSRVSRVSRRRVSSRARRLRRVAFPRAVRCVRASVRARSARCSAPSSSPRIGPAIRLSGGSVLGANRRAQRERETVSARTRLWGCAATAGSAHHRIRRGVAGWSVRPHPSRWRAGPQSGTRECGLHNERYRSTHAAARHSQSLYPLAGRTVSHEPAGCGRPSSLRPIVSPVPWYGPPSLPRASGSCRFAGARCCAPDEREPSMTRHGALRASAPCGRRATWWPTSFWRRRCGPWQGRVPPDAGRAWARVAEPRP